MNNFSRIAIAAGLVTVWLALAQEVEAQSCQDCYSVGQCHTHEAEYAPPLTPVQQVAIDFEYGWCEDRSIPDGMIIHYYHGSCGGSHGDCGEPAVSPTAFAEMARYQDLDGLREAVRRSPHQFEYDRMEGKLRLRNCSGRLLAQVSFDLLSAARLGLVRWFEAHHRQGVNSKTWLQELVTHRSGTWQG